MPEQAKPQLQPAKQSQGKLFIIQNGMLLDDVWSFFQEFIFPLPDAPLAEKPTFNFYSHRRVGIDQPEAPEIRQKNLENYLHSFTRRPPILLLGEAPGWRGCRFSGVPFTSETQLSVGQLPFHGLPSSAGPGNYSEVSASIFWNVMLPWHQDFFVWNALPYHLHQPGNPLTNRSPSRQELASGIDLLLKLVKLLAPELIVAIGKSASAALALAGIPHRTVRHPAHGGASDFKTGIEKTLKPITIRS